MSRLNLSSKTDLTDNKEDNERLGQMSCDFQWTSRPKLKEGWIHWNPKGFRINHWQHRWCIVREGGLQFNRCEDSAVKISIPVTTICARSIIAESSNKNRACSFEILHSSGSGIELSCQTRPEMEDWIEAIKEAIPSGASKTPSSHSHTWYITSHGKPMFCNVCSHRLNGIKQNGLSCEICKIKVHRTCASECWTECKWKSIDQVKVSETKDGETFQHHQWLIGNIPVNSKCLVCKKACGSILRLSDDLRCLWCRAIIHSPCIEGISKSCSFGQNCSSILKPLALSDYDAEEKIWRAKQCILTNKPMLVFVNSKSGDNKGVQFLRRFRQHLNPSQVYDLMRAGPLPGLNVFKRLEKFQVLICGGDGSIGWVLSQMDKMNLTAKTQVGVLPLGTGNDLSQVLGWGDVYHDDTRVPTLLDRYANAKTKMLDRWSIMVYEGELPEQLPQEVTEKEKIKEKDKQIELRIGHQIASIINSTDPEIVLKASSDLIRIAKHVLDITAEKSEDFAKKDTETLLNINLLRQKLNGLEDACSFSDSPHRNFNELSKNNLMNRANSVKKAVKNLLDKAVSSGKDKKRKTAPGMYAKVSPMIKTRPTRRQTHEPAPTAPYGLIGEKEFRERYVMNNYFGIGLDAKIALDFHHYRDKNQKNCGRNLNKISIGVFSAKELIKQSNKQLNKRIRLYCDDKEISLPNLQGVVVLNIPSYMAGINFWGEKSGGQSFVTPSFSDRLMEVIGVFGISHLGISQAFLGLPQRFTQKHRIAQCSSLKIMIKGTEPIPVQVDGEAWLQNPGIIKIEHKNRVQMLASDVASDLMLLEIALSATEIAAFSSFASQILITIESCDEIYRTDFDEEKDKVKIFLQAIQVNKLAIRYDAVCLIEVVDVILTSDLVPQDNKLALRSTYNSLAEINWFKAASELGQGQTARPTVISRILHPRKSSNRDSVFKDMCRLDLPFDVRNWDEECVRTWIQNLHLSDDSIRILCDNQVIGSDLVYFDSKDLKRMGIISDDLRKLSDEIQELRALHNRQTKSKSTSDLPT